MNNKPSTRRATLLHLLENIFTVALLVGMVIAVWLVIASYYLNN